MTTVDSPYLRWQARYVKKENGVKIETKYFLHACSLEELTRFYPAQNEDYTNEMKRFQSEGHLFCIDWKEESHDLFSNWRKGDNYAFLDIMLIPCASSGADDCVWDQEEVFKYMGPIWNLEVFHNQRSFSQRNY